MNHVTYLQSFAIHLTTTTPIFVILNNSPFLNKDNMNLKKLLPAIAMLIAVITFGCKKDDNNISVNPEVISSAPANNSADIALNSKVSATFSVEMNPSSMTASNFTLQQGTSIVSGTVEYVNKTATFTPSANLVANVIYTATIKSGVADLSGNTLTSDYVWNFTTSGVVDITNPTVTLTAPLNNATGVASNKVIAITFSENMDPSTINASTFTLMQGSTAVSGTVSYSGKVATFTPSSLMTAGTVYTANISVGAKDLAGNALATNTAVEFTTSSSAANMAVVDLGAAGNYVILAKTAINNISTSAVTGDIALSPAATSYITGFSLTNATGYATSAQITGKIFAADMADPTPINLTTAVENMITAYNDAAGRPSPNFSELGTGNIGGKTLTAGLYKWTSTVTVPSDVTISGSADDVWIFQIAGDLELSPTVMITLEGGAQAKNIFWQVAGQVTCGTTSHFEGVILSQTGINFQTGATINGRALAQTAVVLDGNTVTEP